MIRAALDQVASAHGTAADMVVEISIPDGAALAGRTLNPRLGIIGGLSILGTTGIVIPYSCAAWIAGIRNGIDVARAAGITHVAGATGRTSEQAVRRLHGLPEIALIDMGDFVGGMLKHLRMNPIARVTIAGGMAKLTKLAQGRLDLHSKRGAVDFAALAELAQNAGASHGLATRMTQANTAMEAFALAAAEGVHLGDAVAHAAWRVAANVLRGAGCDLEIVIFDRQGELIGRRPFVPVS
jgi:cobalt-precorrin-5B (C1)-methyltransferase